MSTEQQAAAPRAGRAATRKRKRLYIVLAGMSMLGLAVGLVLFAMRDSLVFFYTPADLVEKHIEPGRRVRLGGLVEEGSVTKSEDGVTISFVVTDLTATVPVTYRGILPDLFREGQGVIAEGTLNPDGGLTATEVLAKHDEKYMPTEVSDALKKSGRWQEETGKGAAQ